MVKFGKNKFKKLNKLAKKQLHSTSTSSNKIIKKKINAEKKVSFQKEVLLKDSVKSDVLVKNIRTPEILKERSIKIEKLKPKEETQIKKEKLKPVEKHKKRQKTQISDTRLLLRLMNKK